MSTSCFGLLCKQLRFNLTSQKCWNLQFLNEVIFLAVVCQSASSSQSLKDNTLRYYELITLVVYLTQNQALCECNCRSDLHIQSSFSRLTMSIKSGTLACRHTPNLIWITQHQNVVSGATVTRRVIYIVLESQSMLYITRESLHISRTTAWLALNNMLLR